MSFNSLILVDYKMIMKNLNTDKVIKAMLRQSELNSGMANKRKHQVHKDKNVYTRKSKHKNNFEA